MSSTSFTALPAFDLSVLNSYYSAGANLSQSSQLTALAANSAAANLNSGTTGSGTGQGSSATTPPWVTNPPSFSTPTTQQVFQAAAKPIFSPASATQLSTLSSTNTSTSAQSATNSLSDDQSLFTLYQGLTQMKSLASYAALNSAASLYGPELQNAFQNMMQQYSTYMSSLNLQHVTLIPGAKQTTATSSSAQPTAPLSYTGAFVANDPNAVIPGLSSSDSFTISATNSSGTTYNQVIDLSQVTGGLTLNNIVNYINSTLKTNGNIGAAFTVTQAASGTGYSINILPGFDQTVSLTANAATAQPAVYVAGTAGAGSEGSGYLTKFDNLSASSPTEVFQTPINSDISTSTSTTPTTTGGDLPVSATGGGVSTGATAVDAQGNVYVVGSTQGNMNGEVATGSSDLYLRKYTSSGQLVYSEMIGADNATGVSVKVDAQGNVIVSGTTTDQLSPGATNTGSSAFVTKFDPTGQQLFTYQSQPASGDSATGLAVDSSGNIFLSGVTSSPVGGDVSQSGTSDAFVTKLDPNGNVLYDQQTGGGAGSNAADTSVAVDNAGNYYMLVNVNGDAKLIKYADGPGTAPTYTTDLGQVGQGTATGLALDSSGNVYVTGTTTQGTLNGSVKSAYSTGSDGFVTQVNASTGAINYTSYIGGGNTDANAIAVSGGNVYVTGSTNGQIGTAANNGSQSGYVATLSGSSGLITAAQQWGGAFASSGTGIAVDPAGTSALSILGLPNGTTPPTGSTAASVTQATTARAGEQFTIAINGGPAVPVTLGIDDSFGFLAFRINQVLGNSGVASVNTQGQLQITATNNAKVTIGDGPAGQDMLPGLGLQAGTLYGGPPGQLAVQTSVYTPPATSTSSSGAAGTNPSLFALGLTSSLSIATTGDAALTLGALSNAISQVQAAYNFEINGPAKATPANAGTGTVSTLLQQQIGAYSQALAQITALNQSSSASASSSADQALLNSITGTTSASNSLNAGLLSLIS